jgi:hypothetical protein
MFDSLYDAAVALFLVLIDAPTGDGINPVWAFTVVMAVAIAALIFVIVWPFDLQRSRIREHDSELIRRFGQPQRDGQQ